MSPLQSAVHVWGGVKGWSLVTDLAPLSGKRSNMQNVQAKSYPKEVVELRGSQSNSQPDCYSGPGQLTNPCEQLTGSSTAWRLSNEAAL